MVSGDKRFKARIKFVDEENVNSANLLPALVQDTDRNCTKKTCKTVLLLTDKEISFSQSRLLACLARRSATHSTRGVVACSCTICWRLWRCR